MTVKFFGQYLIEQHLITREQLQEATIYQNENNLKFGDYALQTGWIDASQLDTIHDMQQSSDKRFGELAVEAGFLTDDQVRDILRKQKNDYLYIGQALVQVHALSEEQVEQHLASFKSDQDRYAERLVKIELGTQNLADEMEIVDLSRKLLWRHTGVSAKVYVAEQDNVESHAGDVGSLVTFVGQDKTSYAFFCGRALAAKIAVSISGGDEPSDDMIQESIEGLVATISNQAIARFARREKRFEIEGPETTDSESINKMLADHEHIRAFDYFSPQGKLSLRIFK